MLKNKNVFGLIIFIGILITAVSCAHLSKDLPKSTEKNPFSKDAASQSSSFLLHMDDLKAINLAANYLIERGETVIFQETYIEYHEAGESALNIGQSDNKKTDYTGDYLEIRLYQNDEKTGDSCAHYTVVYIAQDGKVIGYFKY